MEAATTTITVADDDDFFHTLKRKYLFSMEVLRVGDGTCTVAYHREE